MITPAVLEIKTFGSFSIARQIGEEALVISANDNYSRKLWGLLEYLLVFRKHGVTRTELIDVFWGDDYGGNPDNNLKALVFRARSTMTALGFPDGKDVIIYKNNSYKFSDAITLNVDAEKFETLCFEADNEKDPETKLKNTLLALDLYDGDFLSGSTDFPWATTLNIYYHSKYIKLCYNAIALFEQAKRHEEIISLCKKALKIDAYDERLHRSLIEAFADSGAKQAAMQHYTYVVDFFITELAVSPSKELTALYRKITSDIISKKQNLHTVRDMLQEFGDDVNPFFCGYATFRDICQLDARTSSRSGALSQLVMLTLSALPGKPLSSGQIHSGMGYLMQAIRTTLRMSDAFCKFSSVQFLLLLPNTSYENGQNAIERILRQFHRLHPRVSYTVLNTLLPVLPYQLARGEPISASDETA